MEYTLVQATLDDSDSHVWNDTIDFLQYMRKLLDPEDELEPKHIMKRNLVVRLKNPQMELYPYSVVVDGKVVGLALYGWFAKTSANYESNKAMAMIDLMIHPEYRRKGLATSILKEFYPVLENAGKQVIIAGCEEEDGLAFNKKVGGIEALANIENRLYLDEIDWSMVEQWVAEGQKRSPQTDILYFNKVPAEILDHFAEVFTETLNQVPKGELDISQQVTPEEIRQDEKDRDAQELVNIYAITQEPDGEISGMTWLSYNPHKKSRLGQGLTSVREHHRGRGLGKWLKADLLLKIREEYPETKYITTHNATSNAPMLSINQRLGFKEYKKAYNLQITMDQLGTYLNINPSPVISK